MSGDKKVIERLNIALKGELTAINQYFLHSRILEDWGVTKMAKHEYQESIEEMQHADKIIQRILLLGGLPNVQDLGKIYIGENVKEIIECDMKLETAGIQNYRESIKVCEEAGDYGSSQILKEILLEEEEHLDGQETQLHMIETMGLERYVQLQSGAVDEAAE
jgi:bacterioferritin